ncbi:MAG: hypothetical protein VB137_15430, partial [Burkholderia sp.]
MKANFMDRFSVRPVCRSRHPISAIAKPGGGTSVNRYGASAQVGMALDPASNTVLRVASAHAVLASLFASAHA